MISSDQTTTSVKHLDKIFPDHPNVDKSKLLVTNVALYSVSKVQAASRLVNLIKKYMGNGSLTVTDATSNVGSDTIMLAKHFHHVNGIELSNEQFPILQHNVNQYNFNNVTLYNGDSLTLMSTLKQDVIYIDAPWTGRDYKQHKQLKLYLSNMELSEIYNKYIQYAKLIIFKVPINYDFNNFLTEAITHKVSIHAYMNYQNIKKFYFIVCLPL